MNDRKTNKIYRVPKSSRCTFAIAWPNAKVISTKLYTRVGK